jgi:hypothetical protein
MFFSFVVFAENPERMQNVQQNAKERERERTAHTHKKECKNRQTN